MIPNQLNKILDEGKEKAEDLANQTLKRVKSKLGFFENGEINHANNYLT